MKRECVESRVLMQIVWRRESELDHLNGVVTAQNVFSAPINSAVFYCYESNKLVPHFQF